MLAVIDYGAGNLRSVQHALRAIGAEDVVVVQHGNQLPDVEKLILPGVGAFGAGMQELHQRQLVKPIQALVADGTPLLGICLGMQFLFSESNEMGTHQGFGLIAGEVKRFPEFDDLKVPHMGWNQLQPTKESRLLDGVQPAGYAYFVHSYYCEPTDADDTLITVDYGIPFTAAVERDNIYGVQFHPEKSQSVGLQILKNFVAL